MRKLSAGVLMLSSLLSTSGCGNPDAPVVSGSTEKGIVTGKVLIRGKPATRGDVSFRAMNINRPNAPLVTVKIEKDGTFKAEPFIGENFVDVGSKDLNTPKNMALMENEQPVKIKSGEQSLEINLPPTGNLETKQ